MCLGTCGASCTEFIVNPLSVAVIRQGQLDCGPRMWAIIVGCRKPWTSQVSHPPNALCGCYVTVPAQTHCAGLHGYYNPSRYVPTPSSTLHSSLSSGSISPESLLRWKTVCCFAWVKMWWRGHCLPLWSKCVMPNMQLLCYLIQRQNSPFCLSLFPVLFENYSRYIISVGFGPPVHPIFFPDTFKVLFISVFFVSFFSLLQLPVTSAVGVFLRWISIMPRSPFTAVIALRLYWNWQHFHIIVAAPIDSNFRF